MPDRLAIDFGTTTTVGAVSRGGSPPIMIQVPASDQTLTSRIPSAVWIDDDGELRIGTDAVEQEVFAPERFEATPKRSIGEGELLLGEDFVPHSRMIAEFITYVTAAAQCSDTPELVLTHPADWGEVRLDVLRDAAAGADYADVELVSEPVAAALELGESGVEVGRHVAVYDFGGGTFDAAVVRRTSGGFEVVGRPRGRDPLGGADIDQRIVDYLGRSDLGERPEWGSLIHPVDDAGRRERARFRQSVRRAKEVLSARTTTSIWVPVLDTQWQLTRSELDGLISEDVEATLEILAAAITDAGLSASELAGVFLVGGSGAIPLVAGSVWQRFGHQPIIAADPKAVVALGATRRIAQPDPVGVPRGMRYRSRLALAPQTRSWRQASDCYGHLTLASESLIVQIRDAPAKAELADWARAAGETWSEVPGYRELGLSRASVLGQIDGLERTLVADHGGSGVAWLERYVIHAGRVLTVTAHEAAREVADALRIGRPLLDPSQHYEPCFLAEVPEGWRVVERVELERAGSRHVIAVESRPVPEGTRAEAWAARAAERLAASLGGEPGPAKLAAGALRRKDAIQYTFITERALSEGSGTVTVVTRAWYVIDDGRGYQVWTTLPKLDAVRGFGYMPKHVVVARREDARADARDRARARVRALTRAASEQLLRVSQKLEGAR